MRRNNFYFILKADLRNEIMSIIDLNNSILFDTITVKLGFLINVVFKDNKEFSSNHTVRLMNDDGQRIRKTIFKNLKRIKHNFV